MKLKKFALRGLLILAVTVALCMFFARTVQTITTPKIQLVTAASGRFEDKMTFTANVHFPEVEEIVVPDAGKASVSVVKVHVKPGTWVEEGDVIMTLQITDYDSKMTELRGQYDEKDAELMALDTENRKSSRDSRQNQLYDTMSDAKGELRDATIEARTIAARHNITLNGNVQTWPKQLALYDEVPDEVTEAVDKVTAAQAAYDEAEQEYNAVLEDKKLRVSGEVFQYILKRNGLIKDMDKIGDDIVALTLLGDSLGTVKAPRSGYIVSVNVNENETYDGKKAAYTMSVEETTPVLRVALSSDDRRIADGTKVEINSETYGTEKTSVERMVTDSDGNRFLYITLPESIAKNSVLLRRAMSDSIEVKITYRAAENTTLLSPSTVRQDGDQSYVYLVQDSRGGFMSAGGMKIIRTNVTVLERNDKTVSIAEDLSYQRMADREDRALTDGQFVMEYVD